MIEEFQSFAVDILTEATCEGSNSGTVTIQNGGTLFSLDGIN